MFLLFGLSLRNGSVPSDVIPSSRSRCYQILLLHASFQSGSRILSQLEQENKELSERLDKNESVFLLLLEDLRREKELRKKLEAEVQTTKDELEEAKKEIDVFAEDRDRRDKEEEDLINKLEEALKTIQELLDGKA